MHTAEATHDESEAMPLQSCEAPGESGREEGREGETEREGLGLGTKKKKTTTWGCQRLRNRERQDFRGGTLSQKQEERFCFLE